MRIVGRGEPVVRRRFEAEREHFGVGGRDIRAPEGFDAGLQELARLLGAVAEDRAEIAEARGLAGHAAKRGSRAKPGWSGRAAGTIRGPADRR